MTVEAKANLSLVSAMALAVFCLFVAFNTLAAGLAESQSQYDRAHERLEAEVRDISRDVARQGDRIGTLEEWLREFRALKIGERLAVLETRVGTMESILRWVALAVGSQLVLMLFSWIKAVAETVRNRRKNQR